MQSPARTKAKQEKAKEMFRLWAEEGKSQEEIGTIYNCSKQYVGQLIKPFQEAYAKGKIAIGQ